MGVAESEQPEATLHLLSCHHKEEPTVSKTSCPGDQRTRTRGGFAQNRNLSMLLPPSKQKGLEHKVKIFSVTLPFLLLPFPHSFLPLFFPSLISFLSSFSPLLPPLSLFLPFFCLPPFFPLFFSLPSPPPYIPSSSFHLSIAALCLDTATYSSSICSPYLFWLFRSILGKRQLVPMS